METRTSDIMYCGVDAEKIKQAHPKLNKIAFRHLLTFIRDRYTVHIKKDIQGLPKPWTDNPILQQYKFTNVRREHDKQSRFYIDNVAKSFDISVQQKVLNAFMFRSWNNWETLETFGGPFTLQEIKDLSAMEKARKIFSHLKDENADRMWYNNAYNQGSTKCIWKYPDGSGYQDKTATTKSEEKPGYEPCVPLRVFYIGKYILDNDIIFQIFKAKNQEEAYNIIRSIPGFAAFLAYQIFVDLTYIPGFPFSENEFVIAGPGCKAGLAHIFSNADGMNPEEQLFWLRDNFNRLNEQFPDIGLHLNELMSDLPKYDRYMNIMSLENCMCELSKYMRIVQGKGKTRRYEGV